MKKKDQFDEVDNALKELQESISRLEGVDSSDLARKVECFREEIYAGISRWSSVELARHGERPVIDDYLNGIFKRFHLSSTATGRMRMTRPSWAGSHFWMIYPSWSSDIRSTR